MHTRWDFPRKHEDASMNGTAVNARGAMKAKRNVAPSFQLVPDTPMGIRFNLMLDGPNNLPLELRLGTCNVMLTKLTQGFT
jgi:hypothetical protein